MRFTGERQHEAVASGHDPEAPAHSRQPALRGDAAGPRRRAGVPEWT